jgi:hypothetical protein
MVPTETLRVAANNVGSPLSWGLEHGQGEEITRNDHLCACFLDLLGRSLPVPNGAIDVWVLDQRAHEPLVAHLLDLLLERLVTLRDAELDAEPGSARAEDLDRLWRDSRRDEEDLLALCELGLGDRGETHRHGLGGGGGLVEERGVGDGKGGERDGNSLEVDEGLETTLGLLGRVGRVRGVPGGVLKDLRVAQRDGLSTGKRSAAHVTLDDRGDNRVVVSGRGSQSSSRRTNVRKWLDLDARDPTRSDPTHPMPM